MFSVFLAGCRAFIVMNSFQTERCPISNTPIWSETTRRTNIQMKCLVIWHIDCRVRVNTINHFDRCMHGKTPSGVARNEMALFWTCSPNTCAGSIGIASMPLVPTPLRSETPTEFHSASQSPRWTARKLPPQPVVLFRWRSVKRVRIQHKSNTPHRPPPPPLSPHDGNVSRNHIQWASCRELIVTKCRYQSPMWTAV